MIIDNYLAIIQASQEVSHQASEEAIHPASAESGDQNPCSRPTRHLPAARFPCRPGAGRSRSRKRLGPLQGTVAVHEDSLRLGVIGETLQLIHGCPGRFGGPDGPRGQASAWGLFRVRGRLTGPTGRTEEGDLRVDTGATLLVIPRVMADRPALVPGRSHPVVIAREMHDVWPMAEVRPCSELWPSRTCF